MRFDPRFYIISQFVRHNIAKLKKNICRCEKI